MNGRNALIAEFLGTFYLCFAGIAAILCDELTGGKVGLVGIALAHGLALSIAVHNFGGISGAHVNPAVSIGMYAARRIDGATTFRYVVTQLAAATTAALACKMLFAGFGNGTKIIEAAHLGIPLPNPKLSSPVSVVLLGEFILTFLLVTSVFGTAVDERGKAVKIGGFGIGLTVAFDILAMGNVTGASMNPARSFGPTLVHSLTATSGYSYWTWHLAYWVAPVAGGVAAALLYQHLLLAPDTTANAARSQPKREPATAKR